MQQADDSPEVAAEDGAALRMPQDEEAVGRQPVYVRLQNQLREEILTGQIPAGARLKVSDIAANYDTSTNPAREALQALEGEGLVVITPNRGARVRLVNEDLVRNIFDIRGMLEPYIVRSFVEHARPEDVEMLKKLQKGCERATAANSHPDYHRYNAQLHDYINDSHFNEEAVKIMKQHNGWLRALSRKNPMTLAQLRRATAEHWTLIEAVEQGDPDAAVAAIRTHMSNSRELFMANLRRDRRRAELAPTG